MLVLVADDDRRARFVVKSMLSEIDESCIVLEAKNGQEMVEQCVRYRPALALVDIHMPKLDGISAIEQCQTESPLTQFAILSGYSDFNDARRCIALNITDYLVKPIEEKLLSDLLDTMRRRVTDVYQQRNICFQAQILRMFHLLDEIGNAQEELIINKRYAGFVFYMDGNINQITKMNQTLLREVNRLGEKLLDQNIQSASVYSKHGMLRTIFAFCEDTALELISREMKRIMSSFAGTTCFCASSDEPQQLYLLCEQMEKQRSARWIAPKEGIVTEFETQQVWNQFGTFLTDIQRLADAYFILDEAAYMQQLELLRKLYADYPAMFPTQIFVKRLEGTFGCGLNANGFAALLQALQKQSGTMFSHAIAYGRSDRMEEIKRHIDLHFTQDIGINSIAEQFGLTPNYLSSLFRERYHCRFIEYLTSLRIGKAKQILLQNKDVSIRDVALLVGYYDSRYFSSVFAKSTGMQPSEFRNAGVQS